MSVKFIATMLLAVSAFTQIGNANGSSLIVRDQGIDGDFPLVTNGRAAPVWVAGGDYKVVRMAADLFREDVNRVSGVKPAALTNETAAAEQAVLIGTLGHSPVIDRLVQDRKLDAGAIRGKWESFLIATVENPLPNVKSALVIVGSDRRGTAYGVFTLSEAIGVSPWYWWADVTPARRSRLYVALHAPHVQGPPSVKYRGIFINDEFAGLHPWASKNFDRKNKHIGPKTYAKIFELLLRLKANFCWPAMWGGAKYFNIYPGNKLVADDYAIVMGSSHCESLLFNNMENAEWDEAKDGPWNFLTNRERIEAAWTKRLKENGKFENVYTLGLRGVHDRPIQGGDTIPEKAAILQKAIDAERTLLARHVNADLVAVPQLFCAYREVLQLYEAGVKVPDDVTLIWADDNYGFLRQLSSPEEQKRSGRSGIYYHLSFFLNTWLCPLSPAKIAYEMTKAYEFGADRLWVFNIGDIKPAEKELTLAMQMAWDITRWTPRNAHEFIPQWAGTVFGKEHAGEIASILGEYYRLAARGMPEFLNRGGSCLARYSRQEMDDRVAAYRRIGLQAEALAARLPPQLKDAYFQLVLYPVRGAGLINERVFLGKQSLELAASGDDKALDLARQSTQAAEKVTELTRYYNKGMAKGKWNHMMDGAPIEKVPVATPESVAQGKQGKAEPVDLHTEPAPLISVAARDFVRSQDSAAAAVAVLPGIGYADGVSLLPLQAPPLETNRIQEAACVEYDLKLPPGALTIQIRTLPTQSTQRGRGLYYGVGLNGGMPRIFDVHSNEGEALWWENIKRGYSVRSIDYAADAPRDLTLRILLPDPGVVLQEIAILSSNKLASKKPK